MVVGSAASVGLAVDSFVAVALVVLVVAAVGKVQFGNLVRLMAVLHAHDSSAPRTVRLAKMDAPRVCYERIAVYWGRMMAPYIRNPRLC